MKRTFALILILMLTALLVVPTFAIPVKSPTQGGVPDVAIVYDGFVDANGNPVGGGCVPVLKKTPYQEKDVAYSPIIKQSLETAYDSYKDDFGTDARAMLKAADPAGNWETKYPGWELQVVNIFDITILCRDIEAHNDNYGVKFEHHGDHYVSMELSDEDASNFVALMHYKDENHDYSSKGDAHWEPIPTTQQGNEIFFKVKCSNLSPFAIVVKSRTGGGGGGGSETGEPTSPQTGEIGNSGYWMSCGMFFAVAGMTALYRQKKEKRYAR